MNAREIFQALLDGKTVVEKIPKWREKYYRMKGDDIELKYLGGWEDCKYTPMITPKYASVKEEEE